MSILGPTTMSHLTIADRDDVVLVTFNDTKILDEPTIQKIGAEFSKLTTEAAAERKLLLSFRGVTFLSSAMLGQIIRLSKMAKSDKVHLKLSDIAPDILQVFKITKLDKIMEIHKTEAEAIAAFGPPRKSWFGR